MLYFNKNSLQLLGAAILFVIFGILMAISPGTFKTTRYNNEIFIRIAGIASTLFFGMCLIFILKGLFRRKQ